VSGAELGLFGEAFKLDLSYLVGMSLPSRFLIRDHHCPAEAAILPTPVICQIKRLTFDYQIYTKKTLDGLVEDILIGMHSFMRAVNQNR
jgi:hypothetical protein